MKTFLYFLALTLPLFYSLTVNAQTDTTSWDKPIRSHVRERKVVNANQDTVIIRTIYQNDCNFRWSDAHIGWDEVEDFGLYPYFELGINNWINDQSLEGIPSVKGWGSWQVAMGMAKRLRLGASDVFSVHVGGDFSWYNFKFSDPSYRLNTSTGKTFFEKEMSGEINSKKSKLTVSYFTLHLMPQVHLEDIKMKVGIGVYGGVKLGAHTKVKFEEHGETVKRHDSGLNEVSTWRYGVKGQVTFRWLTVYSSFDLNPLFKKNKGADLKAFAFGVRFSPF